ncbi:MAG: hypothetical protein JWM87_714 [Candidatus Eremiobacteraeota bacterium]|nr:hypothetical protein [Candidatus Eremiobacteraeota bacterium]
MLTDLPAHVLRLDNAVAAAVAILGRGIVRQVSADSTAFVNLSRARVILGLDACRLCNGSRRSPETGDPCEVCTVVGGSWYPVVP